jgi:hypothetical protein
MRPFDSRSGAITLKRAGAWVVFPFAMPFEASAFCAPAIDAAPRITEAAATVARQCKRDLDIISLLLIG